MDTRTPTLEEIEELVAFLPELYENGFSSLKQVNTEKKKKEDHQSRNQFHVFSVTDPDYKDVVLKFFQVVERECWRDYEYDPGKTSQMLKDKNIIKSADLFQIKTMLTYCLRGERFCTGHWGSVIECGYIRLLLERLAELASTMQSNIKIKNKTDSL